MVPVPTSHRLAQSGAYLETDPLFFAPILERARNDRYSVASGGESGGPPSRGEARTIGHMDHDDGAPSGGDRSTFRFSLSVAGLI